MNGLPPARLLSSRHLNSPRLRLRRPDQLARFERNPHHLKTGPGPERLAAQVKAEVRRSFIDCSGPGNKVPGHTTRAPPVGFELATNGIQYYAIANLDKTSLLLSLWGYRSTRQCPSALSNLALIRAPKTRTLGVISSEQCTSDSRVQKQALEGLYCLSQIGHLSLVLSVAMSLCTFFSTIGKTWTYGLVVMTLDFESSNGGSNPPRSYFGQSTREKCTDSRS